MKINARLVHKFKKFTGAPRPILANLFVSKTEIAATDSYKLLICKMESDVKENCLIDVKDFCKTFKAVNRDVEADARTEDSFGKYPDYSVVFPKSEAKAIIRVNADYLISCLQAMKSKESRDHTVSLEIRGSLDPLVISGDSSDTKNLTAILMPLKL